MKTIVSLVSHRNEKEFERIVAFQIDRLEKEGYIVEVHYGNPAALVIGRVPKHPEIESGIRFSPPLS
jgi:hypothetical protein